MNFLQLSTIFALVLFSAVMVIIGIISYKKTSTVSGFLLGSRKIGPWISAFAFGTSYFSAVIFVGYAGKHGWDIGIGSIWIGIGNAVFGCLLAWLLLAKRTRRMTRNLDSKTMPEFFGARYLSRNMKIFSAIIIFVFLVPYSAAVYKGLGVIFNIVFPSLSVSVWMLVIAVLTAIYLVLGGYVATAYTDFIQGLIMIVGIICLVVAVVSSSEVGGISQMISKLSEIPDNGDGISGTQLTSWFGGASFKFLCINILLTSFGTWGLPQMVTKFYAIKDENSVKSATVISTLFCLIIGCGAYLVGSMSRIVLGNVLPEGGKDYIIPTMLTNALGDSKITSVLLAVIMILLLSASMSTLASVVLSSSSAISIDLIPEFSKKFTGKPQLILTRILCFVFVAFSWVIATMNITIIVNIMSFSWGIVAGCFIGPYIWGIFSKKTTKLGAWCGMISGLLTVIIPVVIISLTKGFASASQLAPELGVAAMAVSIIVVPIISVLSKKLPDKHTQSVFSKEN